MACRARLLILKNGPEDRHTRIPGTERFFSQAAPGFLTARTPINLLQVTDLGNGHVQVAWQRNQNAFRTYPHPLPLANPLGGADRKELRWYLEEYLQFPFGAERYRAQQIEHKLAEWGAALFAQTFAKGGPDPDPRAFYQEAVREGLERCELCIGTSFKEQNPLSPEIVPGTEAVPHRVNACDREAGALLYCLHA